MSVPVILTVMRDFAASPERVFDAWLDATQACHFLFATPDGEILACEIDARVGGRGLIVERRPSGDAHHHLRFEAIERPHRLTFLFAVGLAPNPEWSRVSIDIARTASGCTLRLTHEMAPERAPYEERTRNGWNTILAGLAALMETDR